MPDPTMAELATMARDPAQREKWKDRALGVGKWSPPGITTELTLGEAVVGLIAEVERLLHDPVRRWNVRRAEGDDLVVCRGEHEKAAGCREERFVPAAEADRLRSLLRELEWPGDLGDCHFCDGHAPSGSEVAGTVVPSDDGRPWRVGHAPDCRLAAFLNG